MRRFILIISILFLSNALWAQTQRVLISGVVRDTKGEAIMGAVVMLDGSNSSVGAVTDNDGKYSLSIPVSEGSVLTASCMGYESLSKPVSKSTVVDFVLPDDSKLLDEAVVVGYGSMRRSDLTGSVASVKIDEDEAARATSVDQMLIGRASGVQVVKNSASPDGGVSIRIRGMNTFEGGSEPLYVVDGIIINGSSSSEDQMSAGGTENSNNEEVNGLLGLNSNDIANIEILKDASATAIYGSQGANGVVLITTKMANKERPSIRFSAGVDVSMANKTIPMLSFDEYCDYLQSRSIPMNSLYEDPAKREGLLVIPVNWQDYVLRTAVSQRYYFSVAAHPKDLSYMFSLGYNDTQGIVRNSDARQLSGRLNLEKNLGKLFAVGTKTNIAYIKSNLTSGANAKVSGAASSLMRSMLLYRPYMLPSDEEDDTDIADSEDADLSAGPNMWLKHYQNTREEIRVTPNIYVQINALKWLSFKLTAGGDFSSVELSKFKSSKISRQVGSFGSLSSVERIRYNVDAMAMFNKNFIGGHSLSGTLGSTISSTVKKARLSEGWRIEQDRAGIASVNGSVAPYTNLTYNVDEFSLASFLARAIYNYRDRYVLTATYRLDGSSRFQGANKWSSFPSFAAAWRINEENWFKVNWVSMAKVRLGWGMVGNQAIPSYRTLVNYSSGVIPDHTETNSAMTQIAIYNSNLANKSLKWETTGQWDAGIDIGLWKGRLTLSMDGYYKDTRDLLQAKNIARTSGFSTMYVNQGNIINKGFEFTIEAVPVKTKTIEWSLSGNISLNRNYITYVGDGVERGELYITPEDRQECNYFWGEAIRSSASNLAVLNVFVEGQPMGLFYGFKTLGVVQDGENWPGVGASGEKAKPGDVKYMDINGDNIIDESDRTIIGNPNPDFTFGFSTSFTWKQLNVSAVFNGSFGNDIYNANNYTEYNTAKSGTRPYNVRKEAFLQAWSASNTSTVFPRIGYSDEYISDRYVEDGSYLRMSSLSVSYNFSFKKKKDFVLRGVTLGISASNLFVLTKYSGWDPEVNSFGGDTKRMGIDMGSYPNMRSVSADVKLSF